MTEELDPSEDEIEALNRADALLDPESERATPDQYPRLGNISAGMIFKAVLRADAPEPPEYVTVPMRAGSRRQDYMETAVAVSQWNMMWEAAQFRRRLFDTDDLPGKLGEIADCGDTNVVFVPRTKTRYHEYAPLFHLLSRGLWNVTAFLYCHAGSGRS